MPMIYNLDYSPLRKMTINQRRKGTLPLESYQGVEGILSTIRPKDRENVRVVLTYDPKDIFMTILYYAGIGTSNGIVIDNDTRQQLPYNNNKFMRYPPVNNNNKNSEIVNFDPLFNVKMMEIVFSVYIKKISQERGWYIRSFYIYGRQSNPKTAELCFENGTKMISDQFITDTVCYINLMMLIEGIDRAVAYQQCADLDRYIICSKAMKGRHYV